MRLRLSRFLVASGSASRRLVTGPSMRLIASGMLRVSMMGAIEHAGGAVPVVAFTTAPCSRRSAGQNRSQHMGPLHTPSRYHAFLRKQLIPLERRDVLTQFQPSVMNRIQATFEKLREENRAAFVAYIGAGDPSLAATRELAWALEATGVDILELGIPFSDPMADGAVNQQAAERALRAGATVRGVFDTIAEIRSRSQIPIVLYNYMNPAYAYGFSRFMQDAKAAGADGVLLLDLPPEEQASNPEFAAVDALPLIRLIAPTTPEPRIAQVAAQAEGFIYYVSREGVTGERADLADNLGARVEKIRQVSSVPVVVGFGISSPDQAEAVARLADGVVVGSAIVKLIAGIGNAPDLPQRVAHAIAPLVQAVRTATRSLPTHHGS